MTTTADDIHARLTRLAVDLRGKGDIRSDAVARAIATVPRHRCLTGFYTADGYVQVPQDHTPPNEVLDLVYVDDALVTHRPRDAAGQRSSCSAPGIIALMLEDLQLEPGMRVLEIGAGTGYNAALMATMGAEVVTVDLPEVTVAEAAGSIQRLGVSGVTVVRGDGYQGHPAGGPYDRIIATCSIRGIPPGWLAQLTPEGRIVAPLRHASFTPRVAFHRDGGELRGHGLGTAGFMPAAGPLHWDATPRHHFLTARDYSTHYLVPPGLDLETGSHLWFLMACRHQRVTAVLIEGMDPDRGACGIYEPELGAVIVQTDAVRLAGDPVLLDTMVPLIAEWEQAARPQISDWRCDMEMTEQPDGPILTPASWYRT